MQDKISVVLPVYNGEKYLKGAIQSIIEQTYTNWELIIVNDCSTDNSLNIAKEFEQKDKRIKIVNNDTNKKLPASLNIGFTQATGTYYTWTSDDNEYYPTAFEKMVNFLSKNKSFDMVYAVCKTFNVENKIVGRWGDLAITPVEILESNVIGACFLYRREVAQKVGNYDIDSFLAEDHDYWIRLYKVANIGHLTDELYLYRHHPNNLTATKSKQAWYISRNLAVKYYKDYAKTFLAYAGLINDRWVLIESILKENDNLYAEIKRNYQKKYLYHQLKSINSLRGSNWIKNKIMQLGGVYILKSLKIKGRK